MDLETHVSAEAHETLRVGSDRLDGDVGHSAATGDHLPFVEGEKDRFGLEEFFLIEDEDWRNSIVWAKASPLETTWSHEMPSIEDGELATVGGFIIEDDGLEEQLSTGFVLVEDNGIGFAEATTEGCGFCGDSVPSELNYGVLKSEICDFLDFVKEWRAEGGLTDPEEFGLRTESVGLCSAQCGLGELRHLLQEVA
jgi:hypothetical protein